MPVILSDTTSLKALLKEKETLDFVSLRTTSVFSVVWQSPAIKWEIATAEKRYLAMTPG